MSARSRAHPWWRLVCPSCGAISAPRPRQWFDDGATCKACLAVLGVFRREIATLHVERQLGPDPLPGAVVLVGPRTRPVGAAARSPWWPNNANLRTVL